MHIDSIIVTPNEMWCSGPDGPVETPADVLEDSFKLGSLKGAGQIEYMGAGWRYQQFGNNVTLRRLSAVMQFRQLGIPDTIALRALSPYPKQGLFVVAGAAGSGKTTAWAAYVAALVEMHAAFAAVVADPVEVDIAGRHGNGFVIQKSVESSNGFGQAIFEMLRAMPAKSSNVIGIGEIRDAASLQAAIQVAGAACVITTFHGSNTQETLKRLVHLVAAARQGSHAESQHILADNLCAILQISQMHGNRHYSLFTPTDAERAAIAQGRYMQIS